VNGRLEPDLEEEDQRAEPGEDIDVRVVVYGGEER
jgi:hypothetical protein